MTNEAKLRELCSIVRQLPSLVAGRVYPGGKDQYVEALNRACALAEELSPPPGP